MMLCASAIAAGQEESPDAADEAMDALRGRAPVGEQDDEVLDDWIARELASLRDAPTDPERAERFRNRFKLQITNSDNVPEFVARFAERAGTAFMAELADCDRLAPPAARALAWVLGDFDRVGTIDALEAGLKCANRPDVRYLCARAFVDLRDNVGPNPLLMEKALGILREAGRVESNGLVVGQVYRALEFTNPDRFSAATEAILDVLTARLETRRAAPGGPTCDGGELQLLAFFTAHPPPARALTVRLAGQLAVMLRLDVTRFGQEGVDEFEKLRLVEAIDACEALLVRLVVPNRAPNIRDAMNKDNDVRILEMNIELNKWVGTPDTSGVLNEAPWSVPAGAP
ncbi:MAG: hypothetical protein JSV19_07145 [Phycisphaerales bacterium]|nr:MAG: hypothetical protein JSV19_07145 [Phycisphaerales bacterium]